MGRQPKPVLTFDLNAQGLKATWEPEAGKFGIFAESDIENPKTVTIKSWHLFVGSIGADPGGPGGPKLQFDEDEVPPPATSPSNRIFEGNLGTNREKFIPYDQLPTNKLILGQVIGFFDSQTPEGTPLLYNNELVVEGICSNVARVAGRPTS